MRFECEVKGCHYKTASRDEAFAHVQFHNQIKKMYDTAMKFVVDEGEGK